VIVAGANSHVLALKQPQAIEPLVGSRVLIDRSQGALTLVSARERDVTLER
jgi:hypothetical protein